MFVSRMDDLTGRYASLSSRAYVIITLPDLSDREIELLCTTARHTYAEARRLGEPGEGGLDLVIPATEDNHGMTALQEARTAHHRAVSALIRYVAERDCARRAAVVTV